MRVRLAQLRDWVKAGGFLLCPAYPKRVSLCRQLITTGEHLRVEARKAAMLIL